MPYQPLGKNVPVLSGPLDAGNTNSAAPTPGQLAVGWTPNVDSVNAEQQNYLHGASSAFLFLAQKLGLPLPFNPDANGHSILPCPKGGIVAIEDSGLDTKFYVCTAASGMAAGFADPSTDPTNWALINFSAIAKYTPPYADATGTADAIQLSYPNVIYPVLQDGFVVRAGLFAPNGTTTPTAAVSLNGLTATPYPIKKKSPNGTNIPVAIGDMYGTVQLEFDLPNSVWILDYPPGNDIQPGSLVIYAGAAPPPGVLQLPNSPANISRTAYPALFAAIGTAYGNGDGSTTFGMPYLPAGYTLLQALGFAALGTPSLGQVINHVHPPGVGTVFWTGNSGSFSLGAAGSTGSSTNTGNPTVGGAANLAAGVAFNVGVKY